MGDDMALITTIQYVCGEDRLQPITIAKTDTSSTPVDLSSAQSATITAKRVDTATGAYIGSAITVACLITDRSNGILTIAPTKTTFTTAGTYKAQIKITGYNGALAYYPYIDGTFYIKVNDVIS